MVVGDKHYKHTDEGPVKNVRRNRSPPTSSRGATEDGASTSNSGDDDSGMREGLDYQAVIPEYNPNNQSKVVSDANYATLVWLPNSKSLDAKVTCYLEIAREKYGYTQEQALGMLFWHRHDVDRALADLQNFTPCPDDWTVEDKVLFEQAFSFHGKNFHRIHLMLPDKTIGHLVKYYYSWKKTRYRVSLLDKQARKSDQSGNGSDAVEDSDSDFESAKETVKEDVSAEPVRTLNRSKTESHGRLRNKHKPPSGIYIGHEDLKTLAVNPHVQGDAMLKLVETELESLKRNVIANRQEIIACKQRTSVGIDTFRLNDESVSEINPKWTHSELLLAVQGIRHYGKNFTSIAELIGTKTDHHVRNFFFNYRTHYNLDDVLQEYESEHGKKEDDVDDDGPINMDTDCENRNPASSSSAAAAAAASSSPPPPPLMKQLSSVARGSHPNQQDGPQKPPVLHHAAKNLPHSSRTILHQPPPLFKQGSQSSSVTTPAIHSSNKVIRLPD